MGGSFSYSRQSSNPQSLPEEVPDDQNAGLPTSIIKFMRPKCLWIGEEKDNVQMHPEEKQQQQSIGKAGEQQQQQSIGKAEERSLEELLLASPSLNKNYGNGGEYYVFKSFSSPIPKVHIHSSLCGDKADHISNSLKRLLKVDQVEKQEELISRSQSGKIKKKVSFRLPQESDICIFYSPKEESVERLNPHSIL